VKSDTRIPIRNSIATRLLKIVFSLYLIIAIGVTIGHMIMEYRYQKDNILQDLKDTQKSFERGIAIDMWRMNQESLFSTLEGMLEIPVIVGVTIHNVDNQVIAFGGIINQSNSVSKIEPEVDLLGLKYKFTDNDKGNNYNFDIFKHEFPVEYMLDNEIKTLGEVIIYSSSSVVFRRVKLGFSLLIVNAFLKTVALWFIFLWLSNRLLRKPLVSLAVDTKKISLDNLDSFRIKIKTSGHNELAVIEKSFNTMIDNLHHSILERKDAEKALFESENKYRTLFEKTNDAIFIVEKNTGRYLDANHAASKLTGQPLKELIQLSTYDVTPDDAQKRLTNIKEINEAMDLGIITYNRPDHSHRTARLSVVPMNDQAVIGIAKDITQDLKVENQLRQSQKMESIGTLAGGIAHDFNNILFPIIGYTEMLLDDLPKDSPFRGRLKIIYSSSLRAKDLVKQILTFSRQEKSDVKLIKIQPIIHEAMKLIRSTIPSTIKISHDICQDCGVIKADPTNIHQIFMNLTTNAFHAMEKTGGELIIKLSEIEIGDSDFQELNVDPVHYKHG